MYTASIYGVRRYFPHPTEISPMNGCYKKQYSGSKVQTIFCDRRLVPVTANSVSSRCGTGSQLCTGRIPTFFRDVILLFFYLFKLLS